MSWRKGGWKYSGKSSGKKDRPPAGDQLINFGHQSLIFSLISDSLIWSQIQFLIPKEHSKSTRTQLFHWVGKEKVMKSFALFGGRGSGIKF